MKVQQVREACYTFAPSTGLGWDKLHPRAIARLSDGIIELIINLFLLAELAGNWPTLIGAVLIVLLPKSDGGRRPIGLFPTLCRIWMRVRLEVAQAWQRSHALALNCFYYSN